MPVTTLVKASMIEIAIFPIPNCITFPHTVFPLHVFEPRYRQMVNDCIANHRLLGICHTQKELRAAKQDQPIHEALQSNQATYKPFEVFSAGDCELIKTLEDGRMYLHVNLTQRYQIKKELQTLPYIIAQCEAIDDTAVDESAITEAALLQEKILTRLTAITAHLPQVIKLLKSDEWQKKDPLKFSFEIFGLLEFDAEYLQDVLEMRSPVARLEFLLSHLNRQ